MSKNLLCYLFLVLCSWFFVSPVFAQKTPPPAITIASPREGDTILGDHITFSFVVGNFTFVDFNQKKTNSPGEGHLHLWLDQDNPGKNNANEILSHDDVALNNIPPGKHTLIAEVVNNDHSSYKPQIISTVHFTTRLPIPPPALSPTPIFSFTTLVNNLTRDQVLIIDGIFLFILGFILLLIFGRKKFDNHPRK